MVPRSLSHFLSSVTKGVSPSASTSSISMELGCQLSGGRNPSPSFASSRQSSTNRLAQPPSSFSYPRFVVSLSLLDFVLQDCVGAHPLAMGAHSGNARGSNTNAQIKMYEFLLYTTSQELLSHLILDGSQELT